MTVVLETRGLEKSFGGFASRATCRSGWSRAPAMRLIGRMAGKTTVINLLTGVLKPMRGDPAGRPRHHRSAGSYPGAARLLAHLPDQSLYADLTPPNRGLAVSERLGRGGDWWRRMGTRSDVTGRSRETLGRFHCRRHEQRTATLLTASSACSRSRGDATKPACCCSTAALGPRERAHDILAAVRLCPDVTVLLIEHDMDLVFSFADRISVLVNGAMLVEARPTKWRGTPSRRSISEAADADLSCHKQPARGYGRGGGCCLDVADLAKARCSAPGRNGTGKTTLINSIVGVTRRFGGTVALAAGYHRDAGGPSGRAGIGLGPQERNIFRSLTVEEK